MTKHTWYRWQMACGTVRHKLIGTPYFVDHAYARGHFCMGDPVGLYGAGMDSSGCAAVLASFQRVRDAKRKAEELQNAFQRLQDKGGANGTY